MLTGVATTAARALKVSPARVRTSTWSSRWVIAATGELSAMSAFASARIASINDDVPCLNFSLTDTYHAIVLFSSPAAHEMTWSAESSAGVAPKKKPPQAETNSSVLAGRSSCASHLSNGTSRSSRPG